MATDQRLNVTLQAAVNRIKATVGAAAQRAVDGLGISALSAVGARQRDVFLGAQFEFSRKLAAFNQRFGEVLFERVTHEAIPRGSGGRHAAATDWHSLSLVQHDEVEELVSADRLAQTITHECEWELRELSTFMGSLLRTGRAELERNPLRPEIIGKALFRAIEVVSKEPATRALLSRELGRAVAQSMRACYSEIVADLQARGVHPVGLSVKSVEGPGYELPRETQRQNSAYDTVSPPDPNGPNSRFDAGDDYFGPSTASGMLAPHSRGGDSRQSRYAQTGASPRAPAGNVDPRMMSLIRRLAFLGSRASGLDAGTDSGGSPAAGGGGFGNSGGAAGPPSGSGGARSGGGGVAANSGGSMVNGLMSANLIRAHRDELRQASAGALDHMVIDIVGSLFDQILSDPKVPPQMARLIARLQLPVLRVALGDVTFFSSRRHPVRRFVNRIASLACAFEDFGDGPGLELLTRVRELVQEIVEGEFEHMALYEAKLDLLEDFIARQNEAGLAKQSDAPAVLQGVETELRLQQRYLQTLEAALAPLSMPDFVRQFLSQVWSQTIMRAVHRDGGQSDAAKRFRVAGRELVMSVQPKGSPAHRKNFLMKLPQLMKDLNAGLDLIRWPEAKKKAFFAQLLPAHAESLKGQPLSELDYNMMASEIDTLLNRSVPKEGEVSPAEAVPELKDVVLEERLSPAEAQRIGLVAESAIDWDGRVDVDIDIDLSAPESADPGEAADIDINIDGMPSADPPEPNRGIALMDHVQIGFAYQMHLQDSWKKVRLSYVSPGRAFFVFTHGKKHQQTLSLTSRMLARMCETGRLRPFENAYLIERATARARKQLKAIGAASQPRPFSSRV